MPVTLRDLTLWRPVRDSVPATLRTIYSYAPLVRHREAQLPEEALSVEHERGPRLVDGREMDAVLPGLGVAWICDGCGKTYVSAIRHTPPGRDWRCHMDGRE